MRRYVSLVCVLFVLLMAALSPVSASAQTGYTYYTVARGENLYAIAVRFGSSVSAIASANGIYNPNLIYAGQVLIIPVGITPLPPPTLVPTSIPLPPPPLPPPPPPTGITYHTVQYGQTLGMIAHYYGTTVHAIAQANALYNVNWIYAGQVLIIPPAQPTQVVAYTIQSGDTLRIIAGYYGTTWQAIAAYNNLYNPNLIYPGMILYVPF